MSGPYDDIIGLPHHVSPTRRRMSRLDRAAQFSPFAALTGYEDAIREAGRLTCREIQLTEDEKAELDRQQQLLLPLLPQRPLVTVTYFRPDDRKDGGAYVTCSSRLKRIDPVARMLVMADRQEISLDRVLRLELCPESAE